MSPFPLVAKGCRTVPNTSDMMTETVPADLMSVRALADAFPGIGERWVRRCADERRVPVYRVGGRILISRAEFAAFLAAGRIEPVSA